MDGTVVIKNLEFQAYHGATADERRSLRRFQLDLRLHGDFSRAERSDRLQDAVDYQALSALAYAVATEKTYKLLEGLGGALLDAIAARFPLCDLEIEVRKLHPPCQGNPDYAAVIVRRPRQA